LDAWLDELAQHVLELTGAHREPVSLVGWSLGGVYAREVAKKLTGRVRQVITIGTPFAGSAEQTHASWVYRLLSGQEPTLSPTLMARLRAAPAVPTTSIFSRSDGVVAWQACIQEGDADLTENIEVDGSHCGLGWNPEVLSVIADRLRQPMGTWRSHGRASSFKQVTPPPKEIRNDQSMVEEKSVHEHVAERVQRRGRLDARPSREPGEAPNRKRDDEGHEGHLRSLDGRPRAAARKERKA
jgi:hypothetical protein